MSQSTTKAPTADDERVGDAIRARRLAAGISQQKLGDALGITFQQVQKYEKGTNRISVGRLNQIAGALGVSIADLLSATKLVADRGAGLGEEAGQLTGDETAFLAAFRRIEDPTVRARIVALVRALGFGRGVDADGAD